MSDTIILGFCGHDVITISTACPAEQFTAIKVIDAPVVEPDYGTGPGLLAGGSVVLLMVATAVLVSSRWKKSEKSARRGCAQPEHLPY